MDVGGKQIGNMTVKTEKIAKPGGFRAVIQGL